MARGKLAWSIVGAVVLVLFGVGLAASRLGALQGSLPERTSSFAGPAPDFEGIDRWLNTDAPPTIDGLRGRVVLIDFWTYTCINCVRTFPHLRALYDRYRPAGLEIIGVHSPEFEFERDPANVAEAIDRYALPYPVALDSDMDTWRAYRNNWWPHVYVIDAAGQIRFDHIGEGGEDRIQGWVRDLLTEAGAGDLPDPVSFTDEGPGAHITPEIYLGAERGARGGYLASPEGYDPGVEVTYASPAPAAVERAGTNGRFFLVGTWVAGDESVRTAGEGGRIVVPFYASDVFFVARGEGAVRVLLDGSPIDDTRAGDDVEHGLITVARDDLFSAVRLTSAAQHVLTLEVSPGVEVFTFTFG